MNGYVLKYRSGKKVLLTSYRDRESLIAAVRKLAQTTKANGSSMHFPTNGNCWIPAQRYDTVVACFGPDDRLLLPLSIGGQDADLEVILQSVNIR